MKLQFIKVCKIQRKLAENQKQTMKIFDNLRLINGTKRNILQKLRNFEFLCNM